MKNEVMGVADSMFEREDLGMDGRIILKCI